MITDCISDFVQDQPARTNGSGEKVEGRERVEGRESEEGEGRRGRGFCFLRPAGFNLVECTGKSANTIKKYFRVVASHEHNRQQ